MAFQVDEDDFRWAFSICRYEDNGQLVELQYFDRLNGKNGAKATLQRLQRAYPDIPFQIFFRGDYLFAGDPANYQTVH